MIKLEKPQFQQENILDDCTENMQSGEGTSKERILSSKSEICKKSQEYDKLAEDGKLSTVTPQGVIAGGATKEDMIKLYNNKFARKGEKGRLYYDKIKLLAPHERCPFCGQRRVQTLDHILPKSKFPLYAVTPFNLVPACSDCNHDKSEDVFTSREEETIHPYYDDFTDATWIKAKLVEEEPITFEFYVVCPELWDEIKFKRAKKHFEKYKLNNLYKSHACEEFDGCFYRIKKLYKRGGKKLAIEHLEESIEEREYIRLNTWQAAMYRAIIESKWFWDKYIKDYV